MQGNRKDAKAAATAPPDGDSGDAAASPSRVRPRYGSPVFWLGWTHLAFLLFAWADTSRCDSGVGFERKRVSRTLWQSGGSIKLTIHRGGTVNPGSGIWNWHRLPVSPTKHSGALSFGWFIFPEDWLDIATVSTPHDAFTTYSVAHWSLSTGYLVMWCSAIAVQHGRRRKFAPPNQTDLSDCSE